MDCALFKVNFNSRKIPLLLNFPCGSAVRVFVSDSPISNLFSKKDMIDFDDEKVQTEKQAEKAKENAAADSNPDAYEDDNDGKKVSICAPCEGCVIS